MIKERYLKLAFQKSLFERATNIYLYEDFMEYWEIHQRKTIKIFIIAFLICLTALITFLNEFYPIQSASVFAISSIFLITYFWYRGTRVKCEQCNKIIKNTHTYKEDDMIPEFRYFHCVDCEHITKIKFIIQKKSQTF